MGKCLNCGGEVVNKFCNVICQNKHRAKVINDEYLLNPKKCLICDNIIPLNKKRQNYCSKKCVGESIRGKSKSIIGDINDTELVGIYNKSTNITIFFKKLGYVSRPSKKTIKLIENRLTKLGLILNDLKVKVDSISELTKKDLFESRKNWQSARSAIAKDARRVFYSNGDKKKCLVCGYSKHIEVAHIKSVNMFNDSVKIKDINKKENLVGLCPNHHWEFDNDILIIPEKR